MSVKDLPLHPKPTDVLSKEEIESHSSQLTNIRVHEIEFRVDKIRVVAGRDPVVENLCEYEAELRSWYSYLQTLKSPGLDEKHPLTIAFGSIDKQFEVLRKLNDYLRYNVISKEVKSIMNEYPKDYPVVINGKFLRMCDELTNSLRRTFQTFRFYFRTGSAKQNFGVTGDLERAIAAIKKPVRRGKK